MGLLDMVGSGWDDPRSAAIMALSAGLLKGDLGAGLLGANSAYADSKKAAAEQEYKQMVMKNYQSEIEQRQAAIAKQQQLQEMVSKLFGGSGAPAAMPGQLGSGSFGITPPPQGAPDIPQAPRSGLGGASLDQVAALHALGGPNLMDAWKAANEGFKREPNTFYDVPGRGREYIPDPTKGMNFQNGRISGIPGYNEFLTQQTIAQEAPKALFGSAGRVNLRQNPDGTQSPVSELEENPTLQRLIQGMNGGQPQQAQMAPRAPSMPPPQAGVQGAFTGDPAAVATAIAAIKDPQERANAQAAFESQMRAQGGRLGPYGKTTAQEISEAAEKEKAVKTAGANVVRDTAKIDESKRFNQMMVGVDRAIDLLQQGPTGSGFGRAVDSTAAFFGKSTKGAELSQQLKVIAGNLTSNVPRMEGPQSDKDVVNYKEMAGMVGDESLPVERRLAAAKEVKRLQMKYATLNGWENKGGAEGEWGSESKGPAKKLPIPMKGMTRNGYRFLGGDPANPSSWEKM